MYNHRYSRKDAQRKENSNLMGQNPNFRGGQDRNSWWGQNRDSRWGQNWDSR